MASQALGRTTPGSKGHQRVRTRLVTRHRKVANTRRHRARSIRDAAIGESSRQILDVAQWHGVEGWVGDPVRPGFRDVLGLR